MIFPTLAVVVGTLLALGDASKAEDITKMKAAREKALAGRVFPEAFPKQAEGNVRKAAVSPDTTYVSTGWVSVTYYDDGSCGSALTTDGYAVDTCFMEGGVSYKYQLTGNSCTGGVKQTFSDTTCTTLDSTTALDTTTGCQSFSTISMMTTCTTATDPSVNYGSLLSTYYRAADCDSAASYMALPTNKCITNVKFQCSGTTGTYTSYTGSNCGGTATTQSQSIAGCMTDDDDSHDDAYFPGDASETMAMSCTSGAASLMNSLGAKAVLALVVGAAAFLSI